MGEIEVQFLPPTDPVVAEMQILAHATLDALRDLNLYRREGGIPQEVGVKELVVTNDRAIGMVVLDVLNLPNDGVGRQLSFATMSSARVLDQVQVRASAALGRPVPVRVQNSYRLTYLFQLKSPEEVTYPFPALFTEYIGQQPGPYYVPLGHNGRKVVWRDVRKDTHYLITGQSGAGKSNLFHTMICALAETPPEQVRFVLCDAQAVTFSLYQDLGARLWQPVATTPEAIARVLTEAVGEHERRLRMLQDTRVESVEQLAEETGQRLPYIIVVCEEIMVLKALADKSTGEKVDQTLITLLAGARKTGFRVWLGLQYLLAQYVPTAGEAQACVSVGFRNSKPGSIRTFGDDIAAKLPSPAGPNGRPGRFVMAHGNRRQILQALYIDRATILERVARLAEAVKYEPDPIIVALLERAEERGDFALHRMYSEYVAEQWPGLSHRQLRRCAEALERIGVLRRRALETGPEVRELAGPLDQMVNRLSRYPFRFERVGERWQFISPP